MKTRQIIISLLLLWGFSCNSSLEPNLLIPCDCSKVNTITEEREAVGQILFPNNVNLPYGIYSSDLGFFKRYLICSDSIFISSIKKNKITDSTKISFRYVVILEKIKCIGIGTPAIKVMDLKKL